MLVSVHPAASLGVDGPSSSFFPSPQGQGELGACSSLQPCRMLQLASTVEICVAVEGGKSRSLLLACPAPSWEWWGKGVLGKEKRFVPGTVNVTISLSTCSRDVVHILLLI